MIIISFSCTYILLLNLYLYCQVFFLMYIFLYWFQLNLFNWLSRNRVYKWRCSVNRRHRKVKLVQQRVQVICIKIMFFNQTLLKIKLVKWKIRCGVCSNNVNTKTFQLLTLLRLVNLVVTKYTFSQEINIALIWTFKHCFPKGKKIIAV